MKPVSLATPAQDVKSADTIAKGRERVMLAALDELYFRQVIAPGIAGEGPATGAAVEFHYFALPPGALTPIHLHRPALALWPKTRPRVTVWVWTDGGVPGTFTMRLNVAQTASGIGVGAPAYPVFNHDFTVAPPVANQTYKMTTTAPAASVLNSGELVKFYLARLNDGNANNLYLICGLIELLEGA
jgi:hypothetical protein